MRGLGFNASATAYSQPLLKKAAARRVDYDRDLTDVQDSRTDDRFERLERANSTPPTEHSLTTIQVTRPFV